MKTRYPLLLTLAMFCISLASAQKKPLTHDVYDGWKSIASTTLSKDGKWLGYRITPQEGDDLLEIQNIETKEILQIERVSRFMFTSNSDFAMAEVKPEFQKVRELKIAKTSAKDMPKDSLYVIELATGNINKVARVKNFQLPDASEEWMAWLHETPLTVKKAPEKTEEEEEEKKKKKKKKEEKEEVVEEKSPREKSKGTELVLYNFKTGETKKIEGVMEYKLSPKGDLLFYEYDEVNQENPSGLWVYETKTQESRALHTGMTDYKKLELDEEGEQMLVLATASDKKETDKQYTLMYWKKGLNELNVLVDTLTQGLPEAWRVNDNGNFTFSDSGKRVYLATAPIPQEYAYEEDSTILKDERPQVDVWGYKDPYIQPMQKLQAGRESKRAYQAIYHLEDQRLVQLENPDLESVSVDTYDDKDFFIGVDDKAYRVQYTWNTQIPRDFYRVDVQTGEAEMILESNQGYASLSLAGKYLTWFDGDEGHWFMMEVSSGEIKNLTQDMEVSFANELHDSPSLPGSYGGAGWSENDAAFYIYDRYDIWKFDPSGSQDPINVTAGKGREEKWTFRYQRLDREERAVPTGDKVVLSVFDEWTKASGYAYGNMQSAEVPTLIVMEDMRIYGLTKAEDADRIMLRMSTYEEYPEVYVADNLDMQGLEKMTNLDAQKDPYKWGTNELIEFESGYDGEVMQAILYKPENFDPNKKYPLIAYFYERRSNSLHSHISPAPSASTVNIPYFVSNDYLVLVPDIKYELGYPGKSAMDHVVPATKAVMDLGFVNEEKMAIQGQSWGGYQVAYMVTKTDMYAAAGAGAPVSNMTSAYGGVRWGSGMSRMFQYEKTQSRIGGTLWDNMDLYIENSPLFSVPDINTPLFIMHNDADGAVPWYQGIEFYMGLRRLQKPAWMVSYNDEAHNLRLRKNRKDLSIRMGQFFDHYLKDAPMPEWMAYGLPATLKGKTLGYELVDETYEKVKEGESLKIERKGGN